MKNTLALTLLAVGLAFPAAAFAAEGTGTGAEDKGQQEQLNAGADDKGPQGQLNVGDKETDNTEKVETKGENNKVVATSWTDSAKTVAKWPFVKTAALTTGACAAYMNGGKAVVGKGLEWNEVVASGVDAHRGKVVLGVTAAVLLGAAYRYRAEIANSVQKLVNSVRGQGKKARA